MKKRKVWLIPAAIGIVLALALTIFLLVKNRNFTYVTESDDMFYQNDLEVTGADPDVIYITEGEDAGYYYMYITSDDLHGAGFLAYKSKDLIDWVCTGVALDTEGVYDEATGYTTISFAFSNYWAPEVIYDEDTELYYMFYTANRYSTDFSSSTYFYGDIAVSDSPKGPFVPYNKYLGKEPVVVDQEEKLLAYEPVFDFSNMNPSHPLYEVATDGYMKLIDLNPFIDPATGKKYMYFCHDLGSDLAISESSIYVMELNDNYTANYEQVYHLTSPNKYEVEGEAVHELNEGSVNEAPYVIYNEESGLYYLLYSANSYLQKTYSVRVAVSESPTGPFTKLSQEEGGFLLYAESQWTWASGTGHCSVVSKNGQDYIVYHAHTDRVNGNSSRGIAVDELNWTENAKGMLVPVANGPSYAYLPNTAYLYENIASQASVQAENLSQEEDAAYINDNMIATHDLSFVGETIFDGSKSSITLTFEEAKAVSGLAIYNSRNYDYMFNKIDSVTLVLENGRKKVMRNLEFDWEKYYTEDGFVIPGGSVALEFKEVNVKEIIINMPSMSTEYAISEIAVLSRRSDQEELQDISENAWGIDVPEDDTVTFDGVVDKNEYKGEVISFSDTNGVTMNMYSKMAEDGVFFGFESNDTNVFVNPEQDIHQNTSVEIQLGKGGTSELNANVVQLRVALDGSSEGWIGVRSTEDYEYMRTYLEMANKVSINGELNSSTCEGYSVELYVPYSTLNLEEKPESLICAPSFNTRKDYGASGRTTWTLLVGSSFQDPTSWYQIGSEGQTVMTGGFTVSKDRLSQKGSSNQFYYFDDTLSDSYYVNMDVTIGDILNNDAYPKFGLVSKSFDSLLAYYFDIGGEQYNSIGRVAASTTEFAGTNWEWETNSSKTFGIKETLNLSLNDTVNLELMYYENQMVMLVNGQFVLSDVDVKGLEDGAIPGLFFFNTASEIQVNAYETEKKAVKEHMTPYLPQIQLDADLTDWDLEATCLGKEKDTTNGNSMAVYAYREEEGLYLAYEVSHQYQPKVYMWNEGNDERGVWYYNTNGEFWVNDDHFACTAFGDSGYMVKAMKTTEESGGYKTIIEIFVPQEICGEGSVSLGTAFKTCDIAYSDINDITDDGMKFMDDPWWYLTGHFPTDLQSRFIIK